LSIKERPQDEIFSHLLFSLTVSSPTPFSILLFNISLRFGACPLPPSSKGEQQRGALRVVKAKEGPSPSLLQSFSLFRSLLLSFRNIPKCGEFKRLSWGWKKGGRDSRASLAAHRSEGAVRPRPLCNQHVVIDFRSQKRRTLQVTAAFFFIT
jgi:hypothetical protein